ncbi:hypothetical protein DFJ74DRAFT_764585 [Hyaloraphidium curvatum]|nr:hypothetical protein DFJ74DRAFT_764585 [Hyaloraphidium curvatum]
MPGADPDPAFRLRRASSVRPPIRPPGMLALLPLSAAALIPDRFAPAVSKVLGYVVPAADRVAHALAHEVLPDFAGEETERVPHERGEDGQEWPTDPREVRPPRVPLPESPEKETMFGMPEPSRRVVELPMERGTVDADMLVWEGRPDRGPVTDVLIMISGNPGIPDFYTPFLTHLHKLLHKRPAILSVGHIGHTTVLPAPSRSVFSGSLEEQTAAKVALVRLALAWFPAARVFLAGHSIGAWMATKVVTELEAEKRIAGCYLLFPTLEEIAATPNGVMLAPALRLPYRHLLSLLVSGVRLALPQPHLTSLVAHVSSQARDTASLVASHLLTYSTSLAALRLADDEMRLVRDLDSSFLFRNASQIRGLYSSRDFWCPVSHLRRARAAMPEEHRGRLEADEWQVPHAFVLEEGDAEWVAGCVARWMAADGAEVGARKEKEAVEEVKVVEAVQGDKDAWGWDSSFVGYTTA